MSEDLRSQELQLKFEEAKMHSMMSQCNIIAKSKIVPAALQDRPSDIFIILMMAKEIGIGAFQALNGIHVINGKPSISPQLMLALIRSKIPNALIEIRETEGQCQCTMARDKNDSNSEKYVSVWTIERARKMGLTGVQWQRQPSTMLKWRSVSEAARTVFPDIMVGLYFPDEFQDGTLDVNSNGELVSDIRKFEAVEVKVAPEVIVESSPLVSFTKKLIDVTDHYKDKEVLDAIKKHFSLHSNEDISKLSKEELLDITNKLDSFRREHGKSDVSAQDT